MRFRTAKVVLLQIIDLDEADTLKRFYILLIFAFFDHFVYHILSLLPLDKIVFENVYIASLHDAKV